MEVCIIDLEFSIPLIIFFFGSGEATLVRVAEPVAIIAANLVMRLTMLDTAIERNLALHGVMSTDI